MEEKELRGKINRLKNLPQFRDKSEEEIIAHIHKKTEEAIPKVTLVKSIDESEVGVSVDDLFNDKEEKKYANELLDKYLEDFALETISDINLLKQLIYLEVFQKLRLQKTAENFQKENNAVPLQILDSIHKNLDKIIELKNCLKLTKESSADQNEGYKALELLKKKAAIWRKENPARHKACPHCGKMVLFIMRPEVWDVIKHPFFKDRILGNKRLIQVYKEQRPLTEEDLKEIFEVSSDYLPWLCKKWGISTKLTPTTSPTSIEGDAVVL